MNIDPALLSPVFALLGALLGAGASLMAAIYTHRGQYRLQRVAEGGTDILNVCNWPSADRQVSGNRQVELNDQYEGQSRLHVGSC